VLRSGGSRLLVLSFAAVLGIVITRLIVDEYGTVAYAQYGLLVGIGALLPFTDLGLSAAVMNAVAGSPEPSRDQHVERTLLTATRLLLCSALVLALLTVVVSLLGWWPTLLGSGLADAGGSAVATACLLLIALAVPVGIGQRMLVGLGRNHVAVLLQGLQSPMVLAVLVVLLWTGAPAGSALAVVPYAAALVLSAWCTWLAARSLRPVVRAVVRQIVHVRTRRGAPVFGVAWPMLVQMVAVPLAMQSDRLVLSHVQGPGLLAEYNLAAQMFLPIWAVVNAAGFALWPVYARARATGEGASPFPLALAFAGAAAVAATGVAVLSPWLARLATGGQVSVGSGLATWFVLLMIVQGAKVALGIFLTDARGLRFQAAMIALMLPVNLVLSVWLTGSLGVTGPVIGSFVGVLLFELLANAVYVRRRLAGRPGYGVDPVTDGPRRPDSAGEGPVSTATVPR
jgi:O-antigen/teichoic acid export membrane protein